MYVKIDAFSLEFENFICISKVGVKIKLLVMWKRLSRQPLTMTKYQDAKVFIADKEYIITNVGAKIIIETKV